MTDEIHYWMNDDTVNKNVSEMLEIFTLIPFVKLNTYIWLLEKLD